MQSTLSLLDKLRADYPQFRFEESNNFRWSPDTKTLYLDVDAPDFAAYALHELGHALLGHASYHRDIDLLKIERDAWIYACVHLTGTYAAPIDDTLVQDNLDTYREWLHARSRCPACTMTGLQAGFSAYSCLACGTRWKANDARNCSLRRYSTATS